MKHQVFRILTGLLIVAAALAAMVGAGLGAAKDAAASTYPEPMAFTAKLLLAGLLGAVVAGVVVVTVTRVLRSRPGVRRFVGHYVEMVLAMLAGMGLLMLPWMLIWPGLGDHEVISTLVMAADMTIGMAAWMALRGHLRRMIAEMSAAMVAPFLVLLLPLAAGIISTGTLMLAGHILMFLTMLAAMLLRRHDYTEHHAASPWRARLRRRAAVDEPAAAIH